MHIYESKHPRKMRLINPLSENSTVETLNARKACKAYTDFIAIYSYKAIYSHI